VASKPKIAFDLRREPTAGKLHDAEDRREQRALILEQQCLCELMAGLAGGQIAAPAGAEREIFETHLLPWIGRFFADLERAESADFYAGVGAVGRTFVDIETKAFTLTASGQVL
jgi:hypothetical protein